MAARTSRPNPIFTAELNHQWSVMEKSRSGGFWILLAVVLLVPAILTSLVIFVRSLSGYPVPMLPLTIGQPFDAIAAGQVTLLIMNIALSLVVMLVSYGLAVNSISREKRGKTWDNLILTNISARQLIYGKWLASLRALDGDHVLVVFLRLGLIGWMIGGFGWQLPAGTWSAPAHVVMITLLVVVYSLLDALFNTALAVSVTVGELPAGVPGAVFLVLRLLSVAFGVRWILTLQQTLFNVPGGAYVGPAVAGLVVYALVILVLLETA